MNSRAPKVKIRLRQQRQEQPDCVSPFFLLNLNWIETYTLAAGNRNQPFAEVLSAISLVDSANGL
jgi:hypothetical protein